MPSPMALLANRFAIWFENLRILRPGCMVVGGWYGGGVRGQGCTDAGVSDDVAPHSVGWSENFYLWFLTTEICTPTLVSW